jgi:tetratricopeptide (TPR) repeat protein
LRRYRVTRYLCAVKGWLGDYLLRLPWALFYWNARKAWYRARGSRGQCPCHNPSDSGEPMRTGCEAMMTWKRPARFRRVCPLLRQNDGGQWVCSVRAEEVRPFWLRALAYVGGTSATLLLAMILLVFGFMRGIGYEVSVRQIAWPPAWSELRLVRSQLFIKQAREYYTKGQVREALAALAVAHELDRQNYPVAMMLAQFYQAGNPEMADDLYARLLREHPDHRVETARVWFRSLLARGRLADVAELAQRQLKHEPQQASAWVHALIFAARKLNQPELLEETLADKDTPAVVRPTLELAVQVQNMGTDEAGRLLASAPALVTFAYDRVYRIEALLRLGLYEQAMQVLRSSRGQLAGRDVARLAFAVYARSGDRERLSREFDGLLAPTRAVTAGEFSLLAIHLVRYPDPVLLGKVSQAMERLPAEPVDARLEAGMAIFCAAGVQGDREKMAHTKAYIAEMVDARMNALNKLELFFMGESALRRITSLLPQQTALSLELNYALLDRYL